ncbi:AaceriAGR039Cp [[Ashbya] aceris (nom. inval.)]|nr:AaceriAGR039Cp [[Ashbya] aceris (nom. inval.)]
MSGFVSDKPAVPKATGDTSSSAVSIEYSGKRSAWGRFTDSFKRAQIDEGVDLEGKEGGTGLNKTQQTLKHNIKTRHLTMISLGTGIGTGLLVASGKALHFGGPGGLVIGYVTTSTMLYCVVQACCELGVAYATLPGNYNAYPTFLVDKGFGFAVALVYGLQWATVLPLELVTASMTVKYWTSSVNPDVFVAIFYVFLLFIHFFGSRGYAEAEFIFNSLKVLLMAGFIIMAISLTAGASEQGYIGAQYWKDPGAFAGGRAIDRFKGICSVWVQAAFAYGGSEFIALTAAEQANPRESVPKATKRWLYRVVVVFLLPIILIGFLVPHTSSQLLSAEGGSGSRASPFVIAAALHGVKVVPHIINFIILTSVISVGNSAMYSAPRILLSLAEHGMCPKIFTYVDRRGRPLVTLIFVSLFGLIAFVAASNQEENVFTWLSAIAGLSQLFTWTGIAVSHVRFRRAMSVQGRSLGELGYRANTGSIGSYYAIFFNIVVLIAQFWIAIAPIPKHGELDVEFFFQNYLAFPVLVVFYVGYKLWKRDFRLVIPASQVDLQSHRQIFDEEVLIQEEMERKERVKNSSFFHRVLDFWC